MPCPPAPQSADIPPHEAVRILVRFARAEQATKAIIDLDGRYFGGRAVRATFFDLDRFDRLDLAPQDGEMEPEPAPA